MTNVVFEENEEHNQPEAARAASNTSSMPSILARLGIAKNPRQAQKAYIILSLLFLLASAALLYMQFSGNRTIPESVPYESIPADVTGKLPPSAQELLKNRR